MLFTQTIVFINVLFVVNLMLCDALKEGELGVCVHTVLKTITKRCRIGKKICQESRIERKPVCCIGYEFSDSRCIPLCKAGCVNGTCVAPGVCNCNAPYVLENAACVLPTCDPPCYNARCAAKNVCECTAGFNYLNNTHCAPSCRKGYFNNPIECSPICDEPCSNGTCVEPNKCTCNYGYKNDPSNKFNCLPICEPECVNGECVSPNTCSCYKKYEMAGSGICKPHCDDCSNGDCVAPDECKCHEGFTKRKGTCVPYCSKECLNGYCSHPETCECLGGFNLSSTDKYICEPVCSSGCINSTCDAPEVCKCLPGYESTEVSNTCKPFCESCENGSCLAPNKCECNDGYNMSEGVCKPVCTNFCVNGDCVAPNKCRCYEGYKENETLSHFCYKPCEGLCENGLCYFDGTCHCNRGFEYDAKNKTCRRMEEVDCKICNTTCMDGPCFCNDGAPCFVLLGEPDEVTSSRLASMEMTWIFGSAVGLLLLILVVAVMIQTWRRRKQFETKTQQDGEKYVGAMFIAPHTLRNRPLPDNDYREEVYEEVPQASDDEEETHERFLPIKDHI